MRMIPPAGMPRRRAGARCMFFAVAVVSFIPLARAADESLDEVLVSARKRSESAQDVPISLSELNGVELQRRGLVRVQDILREFPNVGTDILSPRQTSVAIRGLGRNPANEALESSVGVFLDGVYLGRPGMMVADLVDLERIEVLRGPQGALFGKNATAGVINITSARPSAEPEGWLEFSAGDLELRELRGAASGPIGTTSWLWRLSGFTSERDGFTYGTMRDEWLGELDRAGARAQLLWQPGAATTLRLIADYGSQDEIGPGYLLVDPNLWRDDGSSRPTNLVTRGARFGYVPEFDPAKRRNDADGLQRLTTENAGATLVVDWKLGENSLSSITGWRKFGHIPLNDGDYCALDVLSRVGVVVHSSQLSEELRLASPSSGAFQYLVGIQLYEQQVRGDTHAYYGSDASEYLFPGLPSSVLDGFRVMTDARPETDSYSVFGQTYWWPREDLEIAAGLRWTTEEKAATVEQYTEGGAALDSDDTTASSARGRLGFAQDFSVQSDEDFVSGSLSVTWHVDEVMNLYLSAARGAKSGGVNAAILPAGADLTVDPEIALGFEAGIKTQWFRGRLQFNASVFHTTTSAYQASIRDRVVGASYLANAGEVRSSGFEMEANYRPVAAMTLKGSVGYNDARYESFRNAACPPEHDNRQMCDFTGERVAGASPLTVSGSFDYDAQLGDSPYRLRTSIDYSHSDGYRAELSRSTWISAYDLVNARASIRTANDACSLTLWVRNLFNENYYTGLAVTGPSGTGLSAGLLGSPRMLGLSLQLRY